MSKMKIDQDGRDVLEQMCKEMFNIDENLILPLRSARRMDLSKIDSVLVDVIQEKIPSKLVPISMRKRMLYEQSIASWFRSASVIAYCRNILQNDKNIV